MQYKNTDYRTCNVCGTTETKKWYKRDGGYICQSDYRKSQYSKNAEQIKKYERDKYNANKEENLGDRYKSYKSNVCWQYHVRISKKKSDLFELNKADITQSEVDTLLVKDFAFELTNDYKLVSDFICKYEWLGKMPLMTKYCFIALYKGVVAGAVVFSQPYYNTSILGDMYNGKELVLSRGACSSWAPKCLNSSLTMHSINYLAKNTNYCIFTAYSDTEAKEVGIIYQSCNFTYLGQQSGTSKYYKSNEFPEWGWFTSRKFKTVKLYKKFANECKIIWNDSWSNGISIVMNNIPKETYTMLRSKERDFRFSCESRPTPSKHKYVYLLGSNRRETKILNNLLIDSHPYVTTLKYPKR